MKIIERGCKKANFLQPLENAGPDPGIFYSIFAAFAANCTARTESLSPLYNDFPRCYNNSEKPTGRSVKRAPQEPVLPLRRELQTALFFQIAPDEADA